MYTYLQDTSVFFPTLLEIGTAYMRFASDD